MKDLNVRYIPVVWSNENWSPFSGAAPNKSIDAAWEELLAPMNMRATTEELAADERESVALVENGGHLVWLEAFHEIHCVVTSSNLPIVARIELTMIENVEGNNLSRSLLP
jgi:hypothetical protein